MDALDHKILTLLQQDGRAAAAEIGAAVGLSPSAVHRRIKLMEESGVIKRYAAVIDHAKLGFTHEFIVEISLKSQNRDTLEAFEQAARWAPEILECRLLTGSFDYLLRVMARGAEDYGRIHREVIGELPGVLRLQSSLVMRRVDVKG